MLHPFTLAAATDGNHGRAVAHFARVLGFEARIFVPRGTAEARIRAIESEGATVTVVDGDYDATIARSAEEMSERCLVVDDTSWPGYEEIPRWVIQGYGTIFQRDRGADRFASHGSVRAHRRGCSGRRRRRFLQADQRHFGHRRRAQERRLRSRVHRSAEARDRSRSTGFHHGRPQLRHAVLDCFSHTPRGARRVRRDRRLLRGRSDARARSLRDRIGRDRSRGPRRSRSPSRPAGPGRYRTRPERDAYLSWSPKARPTPRVIEGSWDEASASRFLRSEWPRRAGFFGNTASSAPAESGRAARSRVSPFFGFLPGSRFPCSART